MKMGTKFPKIDKNGDKDPQNRQKWGHRSPKSMKMGTTFPKIDENGDKIPQNR